MGRTLPGMRAAAALEPILDRIAVTEAAVRDRFPLYAEPDAGEWTTTRRGSWAAGFWVGQLWLRARLTRDTRHRDVEVLVGEHFSTGESPGRLLNGRYDLSRGLAIRHELIWGDFFLMLALAILSGEVDPAEL